jgi:hypothetical protein
MSKDFDPALFDPNRKHDPQTVKPAGRHDTNTVKPAGRSEPTEDERQRDGPTDDDSQ